MGLPFKLRVMRVGGKPVTVFVVLAVFVFDAVALLAKLLGPRLRMLDSGALEAVSLGLGLEF